MLYFYAPLYPKKIYFYNPLPPLPPPTKKKGHGGYDNAGDETALALAGGSQAQGGYANAGGGGGSYAAAGYPEAAVGRGYDAASSPC